MKNKRGAEIAISTIVLVVVAVVVLVVLVVGFASGWGNLWDRISAFFGKSNIDAVVQACNTACAMGAKNAWCNEERTLTNPPSGVSSPTTCKAFANLNVAIKPNACPSISCS